MTVDMIHIEVTVDMNEIIISISEVVDDDAADLAQRVKGLEKELYVNQEAFNRDIHQEVEKINEDRIGRRSPSRTQDANNARRRCTVS